MEDTGCDGKEAQGDPEGRWQGGVNWPKRATGDGLEEHKIWDWVTNMELFCTEYSHLDSTNRIFTLQVAAPEPVHHFIRGDHVV